MYNETSTEEIYRFECPYSYYRQHNKTKQVPYSSFINIEMWLRQFTSFQYTFLYTLQAMKNMYENNKNMILPVTVVSTMFNMETVNVNMTYIHSFT